MEAKVHLRHAGRRAGKRKLTEESWEGMLQFNFEFQWVLRCVTQRQLLVVVPLQFLISPAVCSVCVLKDCVSGVIVVYRGRTADFSCV